eukprot:gene6814-5579_t
MPKEGDVVDLTITKGAKGWRALTASVKEEGAAEDGAGAPSHSPNDTTTPGVGPGTPRSAAELKEIRLDGSRAELMQDISTRQIRVLEELQRRLDITARDNDRAMREGRAKIEEVTREMQRLRDATATLMRRIGCAEEVAAAGHQAEASPVHPRAQGNAAGPAPTVTGAGGAKTAGARVAPTAPMAVDVCSNGDAERAAAAAASQTEAPTVPREGPGKKVTQVPLKVTTQQAAECAVFATRHALACVVPGWQLPRWKDEEGAGEEFQLVADGMDVAIKGILEKLGSCDRHSDPSGDYMAPVLPAVVKRFFPYLRLVPVAKTKVVHMAPVNAVVRHWGPAANGHFVCERDNPKGVFELVDSLTPDPRRITDWGGVTKAKRNPRRWRLWRLTAEALGEMNGGELAVLAERMREAHRQLDNWDKGWAVTNEVKETAPVDDDAELTRNWLQRELQPKLAFDPWDPRMQERPGPEGA